MLPKAHREPLRLSRWARSLPGPSPQGPARRYQAGQWERVGSWSGRPRI